MALSHAIESRRTSSEPADALVAPVRFAADAALAAHHVARADRQRLQEREWGQSARDTLGDLDVLASTLHGFASWATSQKAHPDVANVLERLEGELRAELKLDLPLHLGKGLPRLREYLHALDELREVLITYFRDTTPARRASPRRPSPKRAKR